MNKEEKRDLIRKLQPLADATRNPNPHEALAAREKIAELEKELSRSRSLPRGVSRRGGSLVVSFALADGKIDRRSVGECSLAYAVQQLNIWKREVA